VPESPKPKPWLNTPTKIELGLVAASLAADGYTTIWNGGNTSHEINPLLGNGSTPGRVTGYFVGTAAAIGGANYALRRHSIVRHILNWAVIGAETGWTAYNVSNHQR
jgi:hypothetical protein